MEQTSLMERTFPPGHAVTKGIKNYRSYALTFLWLANNGQFNDQAIQFGSSSYTIATKNDRVRTSLIIIKAQVTAMQSRRAHLPRSRDNQRHRLRLRRRKSQRLTRSSRA